MRDCKQEIKLFISRVFNNLNEDEHRILCASVNPSPGLAKSYDKFMSATHNHKACYFSTATAVKDPDYDPNSDIHYSELRNQKKFFSRMFCVVLDDIGTGPGSKCDPSKLPDLLRYEYSWCIESSPDNYQYGYLLDEPINDVNAATDFVSIIYGAGAWDTGGALANKLVRLPCGINLKKKYATGEGYFKVQDADPSTEAFNTFTPDELLTAVNAGITWTEIQQGSVGKKDPRRTKGTTPWQTGGYLSNLEGVVDKVVEFLNDKNMIVTEGGDWLEILCPWHEEHSEGTGNTAGYSPLGFGDRPETRGFHCFHGHCKDRTVTDFLDEVQKLGGPEVGCVDHAPKESVKWVFVANSATGFYLDITSDRALKYSPSSWRQMYCKKAFYMKADKKEGTLKCVPQWKLMEDNILVLNGVLYEPGMPLIIESNDATRYLNLFKRPLWETKVLTNKDHNEKTFLDFIEYLIPDKRDAKWFLDHLAAKIKNPTTRGPCTVLTTPIQGSGRGTLGKMLGQLWGAENLATVGLGELLSGLGGDGYNDWLQKAYIIVPEAKDFNLSPRQEHKAYEALKSGIDPAATTHLLKTKWGAQGLEKVYSTYLICSNHENTLNIPLNDRRFKFIRCTTMVKDDDYFIDFYKWLATDWEASVWLMLKNRDTNGYNPFAPVNRSADTPNRTDLISQRANATPVNKLVIGSILFAEEYCGGVFCTKIIKDWIAQYPAICEAPSTTYWDTQFMKALNDVTEALGGKEDRKKFKAHGKKRYLRYTIENKGNGQKSAKLIAKDASTIAKFKHMILACNAEMFRDFIVNLNDDTE